MFKERVLVYGTLRQGHYNHRVLGSEATLLREEEVPGYKMLHLGGFPGVVKDLEGGSSIKCELYEIADANDFRSVDRLEGFNEDDPERSFYRRERIDLEDGPAWLYEYNTEDTDRYPVIETGDWNDG